jgi:hypothetical protein
MIRASREIRTKTVKPGSSRVSDRRWRKARLLGAAWRAGDSDARFSLIQRWRAFLSLKVGMPWQERLALANEARERNAQTKHRERAKTALKKRELRPYLESTRDL